MKNLIFKINRESKKELKKALLFNSEYNTKESFLNLAYYRNLFTKSELSKIDNVTFADFKRSLKSKITAREEKRRTEKVLEVLAVQNKTFKILEIKIQTEWKKSPTWGANPSTEIWVSFVNAKGYRDTEYFKSGAVTGCGFDKLSTSISNALNQSDVLKANLYAVANKAKNQKLTNAQIFGYGSGYGILPYFEGGCGVSTYRDIFNAIGLKFESVASGKTFDIHRVTKK
jgi:hypothetical protein